MTSSEIVNARTYAVEAAMTILMGGNSNRQRKNRPNVEEVLDTASLVFKFLVNTSLSN